MKTILTMTALTAVVVFAHTMVPAYASENSAYAKLSNGTVACETAINTLRLGGVTDGDPTYAAAKLAILALDDAMADFERTEDKNVLINAMEHHIDTSMAHSYALERHTQRWQDVGVACDKRAITMKRETQLIKDKINADEMTSTARKVLLKLNTL